MEARLRRLQAAAKEPQVPEQPVRRERVKAEVLFTNYKEPFLSSKEEVDNLVEETPTVPLSRNEKSLMKPGMLEESLESEETEEEDDNIQPLLKPTFVPKDNRTISTIAGDGESSTKREQEAHDLLVQYVKKEYEVSLKQSEFDALAANFDPSMVDDTDNVDEAAEYAQWRLRELLRVKRDREERERWEREKMELERIRNMTEEERRKLDEEKMQEWMAKPQSRMKFMQKYYHKGAFFMDDKDSILQRDYTQATGEDANVNREILPDVKQVKNFGKKGRTKWTHLVGEDTTAFDYGWGHKKNNVNYALVNRMGGMKGASNAPPPSTEEPADKRSRNN